MRSTRRKLGLVVTACLAVLLSVSPAMANGAEVTKGSFAPFADGPGLGYDSISGTATMVRTASGETIVIVVASGLTQGLTYGSHVHLQACSAGNAGGHYSFGFAVPGGALNGSEIWPGPFTANEGGNAGGFTKVGATAGPEAVSVVIHAPGGAKIACADLS